MRGAARRAALLHASLESAAGASFLKVPPLACACALLPSLPPPLPLRGAGIEYVGEVFSEFLGMTGSRYDWAIEAADQLRVRSLDEAAARRRRHSLLLSPSRRLTLARAHPTLIAGGGGGARAPRSAARAVGGAAAAAGERGDCAQRELGRGKRAGAASGCDRRRCRATRHQSRLAPAVCRSSLARVGRRHAIHLVLHHRHVSMRCVCTCVCVRECVCVCV